MRARKKKSPASIHFTTQENAKKKARPCVFVVCLVGGTRVGPIWGHQKPSVDRALATLTKQCVCPAKFHQAAEFSGDRVDDSVE
jgi:hypothetical protein